MAKHNYYYDDYYLLLRQYGNIHTINDYEYDV